MQAKSKIRKLMLLGCGGCLTAMLLLIAIPVIVAISVAFAPAAVARISNDPEFIIPDKSEQSVKDAEREFKKKYLEFMGTLAEKGSATASFSEEETNAYILRNLEWEDNKQPYTAIKLNFIDSGYIRAACQMAFNRKKLLITFEMEGNFELKNKKLIFTPHSAKLGRLSLKENQAQAFYRFLLRATQSSFDPDNMDLNYGITDIQIYKGSVLIRAHQEEKHENSAD